MGFRLFVPPGEGQDELVPKRPTPLGANATLQYAVFSSTGLAAAYTSFATGYAQRVAPHHSLSRTALFVRSSARLGLWAGAVGAAVNYYYHSSFTSRIQAQKMPKVKPWRLYKRTKGYTVDDGFLAGAAMGLVSSLPMLLLRRPNIPRWTCTLGLTNIGACTGMLGMHGYLQYTGERQKAYKRLDRRLQRKTSIFWFIFWDKELMAGLNPLWQHYVRHQGIWYNQLLPDDGLGPVTHKPQPTGRGKRSRVDQGEAYAEQAEQEERPFYTQPFDYAENLEQIDVASTLAEMDRLEKRRVALLTEAEYLLAVNAVKQYAYCHLGEASEEERKRRLHEIHLIEVTYNHLSSVAHGIESRLAKWQLSLQHKALCDGENGLEKSDLSNWLPRARTVNLPEHRPTIALGEMEQVSKQLSQEIRRFEELCVDTRYTASQRERWRKDLEDGRILLKAADMIAYEFAKALEAQAKRQGGASSVEENAGRQDTVSTSSSSQQQQQKAEPKSVTAGSEDRKSLEDLPEPQRNRPDDTQRGQEKVDGRPDDRSKMGPNKP